VSTAVGPEEFDCIDCGAAVVRFAIWQGLPKRCCGCDALTWIEDPEQRAKMREFMLERGIIGPLE
jgi:hypothetical protein